MEKIAPPKYNKIMEDHIHGVIARMTHRDLQRAVITRGMPFDRIVDSDHHGLVSYFYEHYEMTENPQLLVQYDAWMEEQLIARGHKKGSAMLSPSLRFSYTEGIENSIKPQKQSTPSNPTAEKEPKAKVEKDPDTGVRAGTKKALTYQLALAGKNAEAIIAEVKAKFPDAQDKSVKIWIKRAMSER